MGQVYALLAVFLFIVSHSQVKILSHFPVEQVVAIRALGILIFSIPTMLFLKVPMRGVDQKKLILRGALGTIAIFCYFTTLQNLPLPNAVVLAQLAPFFAILFATVILKEKSSFVVYLLFALALFGVYLIKDPAIEISWVYFIGVLGAAFAALAYNFVSALKETDHPLVVLTWFQFVLLPVALILMFVNGVVEPEFKDYLPILLLAAFSFFAQVCLTLAYQKALMSKASSVNFLSIPLSILVAWFFFEEKLKLSQFIGIAIVFLAVASNTIFKERLESFFEKNK